MYTGTFRAALSSTAEPRHHSQMVETTRMATHERTDTQNVVRAHKGVLLSHLRKRSTIPASVYVHAEHILLPERSQTSRYPNSVIPLT